MYKSIRKIFFLLIFFLLFAGNIFAVSNPDLRDTLNVTVTGDPESKELSDFIGPIRNFFISPEDSGDATVNNVFLSIAGAIKNFFIAVAVIFLIIGVLKLLFSSGDEESLKKWKNNIIWVSIGIFVMQISYTLWSNFILSSSERIDGQLGWQVWLNIFEPIVNILLLLASFAFIAMAVYAFYTIITGGGDEEKLKKGKSIVLYAFIGFLLIRIPRIIVTSIYGEPTDACKDKILTFSTCMVGEKNLAESINVFGKILIYINGFITLFTVVMVIYAGWLVFISAGDEEKLKKAKRIVLYIAVGLILLVGSQAIFRFFFIDPSLIK